MSLNIIVAKTNWCGHCKAFTPVLNDLIKNNNKFNDIKKKFNIDNVNIEVFDYENDKDKQEYKNKYYSLFVDGYPSVYGLYEKGNEKFAFKIDHVEVRENNNIDDQSKKFINNIITAFNNNKSQSGGTQNISPYYNKYLKYKNKYLTLKQNLK